jgi:hypothetical protein
MRESDKLKISIVTKKNMKISLVYYWSIFQVP